MLSVSHLTKTIHGRTIIDDLSFTLYPGERVSLSAPTGAGKSSLIHILSGLDKAFTGTVGMTARARVTLFQEPGLFWYKTVAQNIFYPLKINGITLSNDILQQYDRWMAVTGLAGAADYYPHALSGGMKHKAAMVRAFLTGPDLILMDEPFRSMDLASRTQIMDHIRAGYPEITLLLVTHHLDEMPRITRQMLLFKENQLSSDFERLDLPAVAGK